MPHHSFVSILTLLSSSIQTQTQTQSNMKIQCDVCEKMEASIFCPSDEAPLCHTCDATIHHANKLASKHTRFSLVQPNSKDYPLCDICQERRAHLFCQQDRAILCRECDLPIHKANEHTQKHNRFLLTGVKLSTTSLDPDSSSTSNSQSKTNNRSIRSSSVSNENLTTSSCNMAAAASDTAGSVSTSSISEYLIQTIPGYCFEDFLDASFAPNGFCKDQDVQFVTWVPQADDQVQLPQLISLTTSFGAKEFPKADTSNESFKWRHYACTVPETCAPVSKKSRHN